MFCVCFVQKVIYRSKVRVLKMLVVVVVLFVCCWLPLYGVNMRIYFGPALDSNSFEFDVLTQVVMPVIQWMALTSSAVNPIVYCLFSRKFRVGFQELARAGCRRCPSSSRVAVGKGSVGGRCVGGGRGYYCDSSRRLTFDCSSGCSSGGMSSPSGIGGGGGGGGGRPRYGSVGVVVGGINVHESIAMKTTQYADGTDGGGKETTTTTVALTEARLRSCREARSASYRHNTLQPTDV